MRTFILHLQSATQYERVDDVESFVGEDASGSFGILAGHARMMTSLAFGLARYRSAAGDWRYLALPGAILYFLDNQLYINTRRYVRGEDYEIVSATLNHELRLEEENLQSLKENMVRLEDEMFKRLWKLQRDTGIII